MSDFPMQKITIYHKNEKGQHERYVKEASFRNTSMLNKDNYGFSSTDKAVIRIFDVKGYNKSIHIPNTNSVLNCPLNSFLGETWKIKKEDVVVNGIVDDEITGAAPLTQLGNKYGKENVFKVNSLNILIHNDEDLQELNHVKIGCV